jgi:SAM-dependent methyltransferase
MAATIAFSRLASRYDDELWELVADDRGPPPDHLARFVAGLDPVARALDLGCGDGVLTSLLRADRVVAADVSAVALARARERMPGAEFTELQPDVPLPFGDSAFELVLCAETIEHVRDVQLLLSEIRRVLVPGGGLALTTPVHRRGATPDPLSPHIRFFTRRSLRRLLDTMGFEVASLEHRKGTLLVQAGR